ncbi:serine/threonine protein kinase [bacterium]|nr:serine/threonine protein kinase [bacterium]
MKLGPYEVQEEIGRGGMGVVLRARAPDGRAVALKVLQRSGARDALSRFERERRLLALLGEEAGFVPLLDFADSAQGPFLVMPLLEGGTLRDRLAKGPLEVGETLDLGRALARALGRAHERGIVDLGLAKHFQRDAPGASLSVSVSQGGGILGSAGYMAFEQVVDAKRVGPPADVFALGAILHECLTGVPAFAGDSLVEVVGKVERGAVAPVHQVRPETPRWLSAAIARALAHEPGRRFRDGDELARALEGPRARAITGRELGIAGGALVAGAGAVLRAVHAARARPGAREREPRARARPRVRRRSLDARRREERPPRLQGSVRGRHASDRARWRERRGLHLPRHRPLRIRGVRGRSRGREPRARARPSRRPGLVRASLRPHLLRRRSGRRL